jgi:hypothetical protein
MGQRLSNLKEKDFLDMGPDLERCLIGAVRDRAVWELVKHIDKFGYDAAEDRFGLFLKGYLYVVPEKFSGLFYFPQIIQRRSNTKQMYILTDYERKDFGSDLPKKALIDRVLGPEDDPLTAKEKFANLNQDPVWRNDVQQYSMWHLYVLHEVLNKPPRMVPRRPNALGYYAPIKELAREYAAQMRSPASPVEEVDIVIEEE